MKHLADFWESTVDFIREFIVTPVSEMQVIDVFDILLLSAVLYALYCFLRTRRAGRVLLGLFAVVIISILVTLLRLPALSYVVRLFAASAFFCVVVIFQPEFRDALERLGNSTLLNLGKNHVSRKQFDVAKVAVEETVNAVERMAESRTGALIVFEGLTKLGDYIQTGKIVDARLTSHMLRNIFYDMAPLHDGALVIRDLRIHAASCVLPSSRGKLDFSGVGTRHRAAVGLTEVSDALVVVVSEETGIVSVAQDGKLLRDVDGQNLYDILMTYIAGNAYLRFKRNNLRSGYMEAFDKAEKQAVKKANKNKKITRSRVSSTFDAGASETPEESESFSFGDTRSPSLKNGNRGGEDTSDTQDLS